MQYTKAEQETFDKELEILKLLTDRGFEGKVAIIHSFKGFPKLISYIKTEEQSELVMEVILVISEI